MQTAEIRGATIRYEPGICHHCRKEILVKNQNGFWRIAICPHCKRMIKPPLSLKNFEWPLEEQDPSKLTCKCGTGQGSIWCEVHKVFTGGLKKR